jgi:hypothetical protein
MDSTFCHHGIAVTQTQFGGEDYSCAFLCGSKRCSASAAAAADDQHIGGHHLRAGDVHIVDQCVGLKVAGQIRLARFAAIYAYSQRNTRVGTMIGVIALEEFVVWGVVAAHRRIRAGPVALDRVFMGNIRRHHHSA